MRTWIEAPFRRVLTLTAAGLLVLALTPASRLAAQSDDDTDDDAPRQDIHMGNTQNMHMGRNAKGDVIMEVHPPPKDPASQPQVGPFYIYPQIGTPYGTTGGQQSMPGGRQSMSGSRQGSSGQSQYGMKPPSGSSGRQTGGSGASAGQSASGNASGQSNAPGSAQRQPTTSGSVPVQPEQPSANRPDVSN